MTASYENFLWIFYSREWRLVFILICLKFHYRLKIIRILHDFFDDTHDAQNLFDCLLQFIRICPEFSNDANDFSNFL